jgi:hypothetical protein
MIRPDHIWTDCQEVLYIAFWRGTKILPCLTLVAIDRVCDSNRHSVDGVGSSSAYAWNVADSAAVLSICFATKPPKLWQTKMSGRLECS